MFFYLISISNFFNEKDYHILSSTTPWREIVKLIKSDTNNNTAILNIGASPSINYYLDEPANIYSYNLKNKFESEVFNNISNLWVVVANPSFDEEFKNINETVVSKNFYLVGKGFKRDLMFTQEKVFRKHFSDIDQKYIIIKNRKIKLSEKFDICIIGGLVM